MPLSRLSRIFGRKANPPPSIPDGMRVYAVGDVHGRDDLLGELASRIEADLRGAPDEVITVFLGDYVDRGPHSASVIARLVEKRFPTPVRALRGNHEEMLLQFLREPATLGEWRRYGGLETLHSYGVSVAAALRGEGFDVAHEELVAALPEAHLNFLNSAEFSLAIGDYFFCHAGVRPEVPLTEQRPEDLLWIREGFLRFDRPFEKVVVHGHTPVGVPDVRPNRINIDTGAFATSVLTCVALEGQERRFISAVGARPQRRVEKMRI